VQAGSHGRYTPLDAQDTHPIAFFRLSASGSCNRKNPFAFLFGRESLWGRGGV
jgi:hypothetical protein